MNSFTRWWEVARREFPTGLRQPAFWLLCVLLGMMAWSNSWKSVIPWTSVMLATGVSPYITSAVSQGMSQSQIVVLTAPWFLAMTLGLVVIRDIELRIVEVFNSTRLTPREYVWAKFSGGVGFFLVVWGLYLGLSMGFNHIIQASAGSDLIGPFALGNYLFPTLLVGLPQILLYAGVSFFIGVWTRRPVLVFLFPLGMLLYWLMGWPDWLPQGISDMLAVLEPTGRIWTHETFIRGDRSVEFLNTTPLIPDIGFVLSRIVLAGIGLAGVAGAAVSYARWVQTGESGPGLVRRLRGRSVARAEVRPMAEPTLADLEMATRPLGFWKAAAAIARGEIRDLLVRPGMYLCVPLILWMTTETAGGLSGPLDLRNLLTPGTVATSHLFDLSLMICFLLLFYTVESLHKERSHRMHEIFGSAPVGTGAVLLGKTLGNSVMAAFILVAALLLNVGVFLYKQIAEGSPVGFELLPFVAAWGAVLLPTFIFWTALVTALFGLFRNRYVVYGAGVAVIAYTTFILGDGTSLNWTVNWLGANVLQWSDMGAFALHGYPLLLNRLLYLSLVPLLIVLSVRWFGRRDFDATGLLSRLRPKPLLLGALRLIPLAFPAIVLASILALGGRSGYQGPGAEEREREYWSRNIATWNGFRMPSVSQVDLDLAIEPSERSVAVAGAYTFFNHRDYAYDRFPLTAGPWDPIEWTLGGEPYAPEDRAGLYIFEPAEPLKPGDTVTVGFSYDVEVFGGIGKTPEGLGKFVLESGVNLDGFEPLFVPVPGYRPEVGSEYYDPAEYEDEFHEGQTEPMTLWAGPPFMVRTRITLPEEYTANGVGRLVSDEVADGRRTVAWETDHPVAMFNVVAGKYAVREGEGTAIYYHPKHDYNLEEMAIALDAAREYYAEWFHPFPWSELKLSEFPDYRGGAQGFPTNIVVSEGSGFLAKSEPGSRGAFMVVAHEAAHQWWGNLLTPGEGPGGNALLSEGMAEYATTLLHEQVYGDRARMQYSEKRELAYVRFYVEDLEPPLVEVRNPEYDKGPWVMWMLQQKMGRENILAGLQAFIAKFNPDPDFPVIQDMLAVLRDFAPDTTAFDAFAEQWFFDVVLPEYRLFDVTKTREGGEWMVRGTVENVGTGRMAVQVGATAGERWSDEGDDGSRTVVAVDYRDARTEVELGAGESAEFVIRAAFDPERVLIDPDVLVLQLNREAAAFEF